MKRLILLSAAAALLSLSACGNAKEPTTEAVTTTEIVIENETESGTEPETSPEESSPIPEEQEAESSQAALLEAENPGTTVQTTAETVVYQVKDMDKTMYAIKAVNVRASYTTGSDVLSHLKAGQQVEVTGMSENGWIRIKYNGKDAFVYKDYLSEDKGDVETTAAKETKKQSQNQKPKESKPAETTAATAPAPAEVPETIPPSPIS